MKLVILLLILLCVIPSRANMFPATNEICLTHEFASYDTSIYVLMFAYMKGYTDGMYPQYTNHFMPVSRSNASIGTIWTETQAKRNMPFWSWFNHPVWDIESVSENGGGNSNNIVDWSTNLFNAPPLFWNGTAITNEGVPFPPIIHVMNNGINDDPYNDPSRNLLISMAGTYVSSLLGTTPIDLWGMTYTNGLNTDTSHLFGFYAGGHPYPAGHLAMALWTLIALGAETNIGSLTINFLGGSVSGTNNLTAINPSLIGNTFTLTLHCTRIPGGWDVPNGNITNDARNCFVIYPMLANIYTWTFKATNLSVGTYNAYIDDILVDTATDSQWATGRNWFTNYNGPLWAQRNTLLTDTRNWYGVNPVTLVEIGQTGPLGPNLIAYLSNSGIYPGVTGTNYVNTMRTTYGWPNNMFVYDTQNYNDAQQTNHTFKLSKVTYNAAPFSSTSKPRLISKQLQANITPKPTTFHIPWPNDPWLQSGSWIVVESPEPQGPYVFYAQTTHDWIDVPMTNSQRFFNYCRAEDYNP